jgi:hypothetical protein
MLIGDFCVLIESSIPIQQSANSAISAVLSFDSTVTEE